jgi:death on curing protein
MISSNLRSRAHEISLRPEAQAGLGSVGAAYAFGIARNHAFIDGNKRTSLIVIQTFVNLNGMDLAADDAEMLQVWSDLGAGNLSEEALADWIRKKLIE